ncbi:uncharacterized protein LOC143633271 [Bidens hawaiensis]|uniref:uncharacterized protein LOC143633271 n=1 Tax=Bidens hawaiensis TaxID=980011 RepID=UPI0040498790
MKQKSRVRWASFGDDNSAYFHNMVNGRKARNAIPGLEIDGEWVSKPPLVKKHVLKFFRDHFKEKFKVRPPLECDDINKVPMEYKESLIEPFSRKEIKDAVFDCGADKAPGPDGFNFKFVKRFWSLFEDDFYNIFSDFHEAGIISKVISKVLANRLKKVLGFVISENQSAFLDDRFILDGP